MTCINLPNCITIGRISLVPIFVACYFLGAHWRFPIAWLVFTLAMLSDWVDGYLARKLQQASRFGAFLDPLADKLIVIAALILLLDIYSDWVYSLLVLLMVMREIIMSALREWLAQLKLSEVVAVSSLGKIKTALQMLAIFFLMLGHKTPYMIYGGYALLILAAFFSVWSLARYWQAASGALAE